MEAISMNATPVASKKLILAGRIVTGIAVLFLLVDAVMKVVMNDFHVESTMKLGWSESAVRPIGLVLLACTILYIIPRTAIAGAILLTGYLGGAVANMSLIHESFAFPLIFGIFVWAGLLLRNEKARSLVK